MAEDGRRRRHRWRGIVGLGVVWTLRRALRTRAPQTLLSVAGVAVAIALLLGVTSVGLGLAGGATVASDSAEYWIVPEDGASSVVAPAEGQRFGRVHESAATIDGMAGVNAATPVLVSLVRINTSEPGPTYALALGVVAGPDQDVAGLSTGALTPGDPYFDGGDGRGPRTGEAVVSRGAVTSLGLDPGDRLTLDSGGQAANRTFVVTTASRGRAVGFGQLPVLVVHLSELQAITGADEADAADMILVDAAASGPLEARLEGVYPHSTVVHRSELLARQLATRQLPAAMSVAAALVAVVVGTLFVVTSVGFELAGDARLRAVLAAVGVSARSRALLVTTRTLVMTGLGGLLGVALWAIGLVVVNGVATRAFGVPPPARFHPLLVGYGAGVALLVGLLAAPYLLVTSRRSATRRRLED